MSTTDKNTFAVSVILPDKVGIVRDIARAVAGIDGNIGDIRQLVVAGCFTLTFVVDCGAGASREQVESVIREAIGAEAGVAVLPFTPPPHPVVEQGSRHVFTVTGPDAPGRLFTIAQFFMEGGINIEDLRVLPQPNGDVMSLGIVVIPQSLNLRDIQYGFSRLLEPINLKARILHENIFRATNEIGPIGALLFRDGGEPEGARK